MFALDTYQSNTSQVTTNKKIGDLINIECDMIGKYVFKACETLLQPGEKKPSLDFLLQ